MSWTKPSFLSCQPTWSLTCAASLPGCLKPTQREVLPPLEFPSSSPLVKHISAATRRLLGTGDKASQSGDEAIAQGRWKVQMYVGPALSGAPFHSHGPAFNVLVRGSKQWWLLPPGICYAYCCALYVLVCLFCVYPERRKPCIQCYQQCQYFKLIYQYF